jgi:hypothetical protein
MMANEITTTKDDPTGPKVDPANGDHVGPGIEGGSDRENPSAPKGDLSGDEAAARHNPSEVDPDPRGEPGYHVEALEVGERVYEKVPEPTDHPQGSAAVDEDPEQGHNHPETAWCVESCPVLSRKRKKS